MSVKERLLNKLEHLGDEDFKMFKWLLPESDIPKCKLEKADRMDTVDKIIQTYDQQSAEVVKKILEKIKRGDLVKELSSTRTGAQGELQEDNNVTLSDHTSLLLYL